eukprot:scaffold107420_cov18-Tisochrysis_lutea.AAC.1
MDPEQLQCAQAELRLLIFPGAQLMVECAMQDTLPVLYRNVGVKQGATFTSVGNTPPMLLAAYPEGLPEAVQEYVDQQRQVGGSVGVSAGVGVGVCQVRALAAISACGWLSGWEWTCIPKETIECEWCGYGLWASDHLKCVLYQKWVLHLALYVELGRLPIN